MLGRHACAAHALFRWVTLDGRTGGQPSPVQCGAVQSARVRWSVLMSIHLSACRPPAPALCRIVAIMLGVSEHLGELACPETRRRRRSDGARAERMLGINYLLGYSASGSVRSARLGIYSQKGDERLRARTSVAWALGTYDRIISISLGIAGRAPAGRYAAPAAPTDDTMFGYACTCM